MKSSSTVLALVGTPNSGKSTLYNWLTGSRAHIVNYPGSTVDYAIGTLAPHLGGGPDLLDTPGVYSLEAKSADEEVTLKALFEKGNPEGEPHPVDGVIVVVDGTQLSRQLHLALQIKRAGFSMILVITMADILKSQGIQLDLELLRSELDCSVLLFDGLLAGGLKEVAAAAQQLKATREHPHRERVPSIHDIQSESLRLAEKAWSKTPDRRAKERALQERSKKWDRLFLHSALGPVLFFLIMASLFTSIYFLAAPLMDAVEAAFAFTSESVTEILGPGLFTQFLTEGIIASFAAVLVFAPQIFILFFGIGLLESTGYLARAATMIDRPFARIGLTGRSFVPLLSGFSCAVPALMATRNISSARDRWITSFIIPLMTCSARLPVYALLLGFLFAENPLQAGLGLAFLYFLALCVGALVAAIINRFLPKDRSSYLLMDLPMYRAPQWRAVIRQSLRRTGHYVTRAGPIIFALAVIIWAGTNFPQVPEDVEQTQMEYSVAGRLGHVIEPVFEPMGVDWRVGVGLMSAFAAREVFVATMAVLFQITDEDEEAQVQGLLESMKTARRSSDGALIFTPATVAGLLVFFVIALQCMSTFAVAKRETNSWKFALSQLVLFNILAYVLAVGVVQGLRAFGIS